MTPQEINQIISAEIPDKKVTVTKKDAHGNSYERVETNPIHDLVTNKMLHGPCGPMFPCKSCMRDG